MFTEPTQEAYSSNPAYQFVQINLQENLLKSLLVSLFTKSIRKSIPEEQWGRYLVSSQNMEYVTLSVSLSHTLIVWPQQLYSGWFGCNKPPRRICVPCWSTVSNTMGGVCGPQTRRDRRAESMYGSIAQTFFFIVRVLEMLRWASSITSFNVLNTTDVNKTRNRFR